ncbi:hypothetical protein ANRL3_00390 [Anaerolineae bacterium]|nr:hypothetical protein ANRL3_00390 [Anaerolineae bacterium]
MNTCCKGFIHSLDYVTTRFNNDDLNLMRIHMRVTGALRRMVSKLSSEFYP